MKSSRLIVASLALTYLTPVQASAQDPAAAQKIYGRTPAESSPPSWPQEVRPPAGAPNILVIITDDVGFGASSTFGGPVPTPAFDALAKRGLRYNRFHTTAICSPTRASLLTGRNPQEVGVGYVTNWASGFDGYNSVIPKSAGTVAQVLKGAGYNTAMFGKGHITPEWEMSPAGPFDRWPTGLGFEYYYGFLGADTSAFQPSLVENTRVIPTPQRPGYILDRDLADHAITWIATQHAAAPDKPFFAYYASGTAHAPNHAPPEWLAKFKGKFDAGWDVLRAENIKRQKALGVIPANADDAPRPSTLPRWDSLTPEQKKLCARYMEAYAAALAFADHEIGRVIDSLRANGELDNTLIVYIQGDNGSSAEGSFLGKLYEQSALSGVPEDPDYNLRHIDDIGTAAAYNLYPGGWGWALNAPFPWAKRYGSHFGGTRNAMVLSWPGHIKDPGSLRQQFLHVSDIMPTLLDAAGVTAPAILNGIPQQPITGLSARYTFEAPDAPSRRRMQVFAMSENLALYKDGWVAATTPMVTPWEKGRVPHVDVADRKWELYDTTRDFSEAHDVAAANPAKLEELKAEFWAEAAKAKILPIHSTDGLQGGRPDLNAGRTSFTYRTRINQLTESAAPETVGHSFTIAADVVLPSDGGQGVIVAQGGRFGGFSLFLDHGKPVFTYNLTPAHVTRIAAGAPLGAGVHKLSLSFQLDKPEKTSGGAVVLKADGREVARGRVERTFAQIVSHTEGFDIGEDAVTAVDASYTPATSHFTGDIAQVKIDIEKR